MSDELEGFLRAEFHERAGAAPASAESDLAGVAIRSAGRIRRRRRVGASAGALALVVLGTATLGMQPWKDDAPTGPPPVAATSDEVQEDLAIEFAVKSEGGFGVVNTDGDLVPMPSQEEPYSIERLDESYLVTRSDEIDVVALGGDAALSYPAGEPDEWIPYVRGDAREFAVGAMDDATEIMVYTVHSGAILNEPEPRQFALSYDVDLEDWSDSTVVLSAELRSVTGGETGRYYFEDQYDWGLESVAQAGYEAAVITDWSDPTYVCVSDLEAGVDAPTSEQCGDIDAEATVEEITMAAADQAAPELAAGITDSWYIADEALVDPDIEQEGFFATDHSYVDPRGRWVISYNEGDETWKLADYTGGEPEISELVPPEGAMFPVLSHK